MKTRDAALLTLAAVLAYSACKREAGDAGEGGAPSRTERRIDEQLAAAPAPAQREGLAAAIVIDVSGSMDDDVRGESGQREPKIEIARRAARELVNQFARYAEDHPGEPVLLGLYEFSERSGKPDCRPVIAMAPPDRARADRALASMRAQGGTPIGNAMITAKRELDATGLSRRHLLVVTDGENTDGFEPEAVAAAINSRPEGERPSLYFVAFDIDARRFEKVREAGALVLGAADARDLNATLDSLLRGQILLEK
ncbi:MAG TPA: VWA domain-containing protein [Vicinamibacterales bacterium]|nr:VWA domain-containing protein [Vicinamibacterales bacterium]